MQSLKRELLNIIRGHRLRFHRRQIAHLLAICYLRYPVKNQLQKSHLIIKDAIEANLKHQEKSPLKNERKNHLIVVNQAENIHHNLLLNLNHQSKKIKRRVRNEVKDPRLSLSEEEAI